MGAENCYGLVKQYCDLWELEMAIEWMISDATLWRQEDKEQNLAASTDSKDAIGTVSLWEICQLLLKNSLIHMHKITVASAHW